MPGKKQRKKKVFKKKQKNRKKHFLVTAVDLEILLEYLLGWWKKLQGSHSNPCQTLISTIRKTEAALDEVATTSNTLHE